MESDGPWGFANLDPNLLYKTMLYTDYTSCEPHVLEDFLKGFPHYKSVEAKL